MLVVGRLRCAMDELIPLFVNTKKAYKISVLLDFRNHSSKAQRTRHARESQCALVYRRQWYS